MPTRNPRNTVRYHKTLERYLDSFPCAFCKMNTLARVYEAHCTQNHGINTRRQCVWCQGRKQWKHGEKEYQIDAHVMECFKAFMIQHCPPERMIETPVPEAPETFSKFPDDLICEPLDMFGRSKLRDLHPLAYDFFELLPYYPMELTYQNPNLNLAASYVRYYEAEKDNMDFYHVMIRATAMNSTIRALGLYEDDPRSNPVKFLPFSCWCDGGPYAEDYFRQHRHMIAVAPKGMFFQSFWKKIKAVDRPDQNYKCKTYEPIECALHLVNTMGYLSQQKSSCHFTFSKKNEGKPERMNHFVISTPLLKDFRFIMALQWDGGMMELLSQINCRLNPAKFIHLPIELRNGKWHIKIRYLPNILLNLVLPISKKFKPSKTPTEYFVHLNRGKKFYFELAPDFEELDDDTWHQKQLELGNAFYHVMGEEYWTLNPYQQKYVNDVKSVWELNEELKTENAQLKRNCEENIQLKRKIAELKTENDELKTENAKLKQQRM